MSNEKELEVSIEEAKAVIEKKRLLEKLMSNREFKKVILDGYFKEEAIRLVGVSADPNPQLVQSRDQIQLEIQGISLLRNYLRTIMQFGEIAEREVAAFEEELENTRTMEGEDY